MLEVGNRAHGIRTCIFFIPLLLSGHAVRGWQSFHLLARFFSLKRLVVVDTQYLLTYGMQQFLYWRTKVLFLRGGHQEVIAAAVGDGRWHELLVNNRRWGLVLNHCRAMLLSSGPPLAPRLAPEP